MKQNENVKDTKKKIQHAKFLLIWLIVFLLSVIIIVPIVAALNQKPKPDPASERIIREAAARLLDKDPNELKDSDFAKIIEFSFHGKNDQNEFLYVPPWVATVLADIRLLKKFTNLERLDLISIRYPPANVPKWMKYLSKYGIIKLSNKFAIDLSPIQNLHALKKLRLNNAQIDDIKPLKNLTDLEELYIQNCDITDKQVEELQKALPNCKIYK